MQQHHIVDNAKKAGVATKNAAVATKDAAVAAGESAKKYEKDHKIIDRSRAAVAGAAQSVADTVKPAKSFYKK